MWQKLETIFLKLDTALIQRFVAEGTAKSTALVTTIIMARTMGIEGFGQLSQIQAFVVLLVPLTLMGLNFAIVRQVATLKSAGEIGSAVFTCFLLISTALLVPAACLWCAADQISLHLSMGLNTESAIQASALLLICTAWQTLILEAMRARQQAFSAMTLQLLESIGSLSLIGAIAVFSELMPLAVILSFAFVKLFIFLFGVWSFTRNEKVPTTSTNILPLSDIKTALGVGVPLMLAAFGEVLMGVGDRILIGRELGQETLARYVIAQTLIGLLASWGAPYWWLLYPRLAKALAARKKTEAITAVHQLIGGFIEWGTLVAAMLIILGPLIITTTVGQTYLVDTKIVFVLLLAVFFNQIATPWEYALYVQGQTMILMWATLFWGLTTLVGVLLFLPPFGLLGACCAIAIARFGFALTTLRYATRVGCGLVLIPLKTAKRALIGVIAAAIVLILGKEALNPVGSAILFAISYAMTVTILKRFQASRAEDA